MSDQLKQQQITALLEERRGYEARLIDADDTAKKALTERIAAVNVALTRAGYKPEAAVKAAKKTPPATTVSKKAPARKAAKR